MWLFREDLLPMLAERTLFSDVLLVLGLGMITTWLVLRIRKHRAKAEPTITPSQRAQRLRQERGMRGDLEDLMVEIEQLAKRFSAQLDAKSIQLERLLREADERIQQLQQLEQAKPQPGFAPEPDPAATPVSHATPPRSDPAALNPSGASTTAPHDDPLVGKVHDLADRGMEAIEIARALDAHLGKVELILALRQTRT